MSKGLCEDGTSIDQKVKIFQASRKSDDLVLVQKYYEGFKEFWYRQVEDYIEREEFDRDWSVKLLHSMDTYQEDKAIQICRNFGWSLTNKFNRWFYSALKNWISNIKTQAFRIKKRPAIVCPICFRDVCKIEERHLRHVRETKDIPKVFEHNNKVYKTYFKPLNECKFFECTMSELKRKVFIKSSSMKWPWHSVDGSPGVMCPYTKTVVPIIDDEYINTLPKKYKHYAEPYTWSEFQEEFPSYLVHSELMSLDYSCDNSNKGRILVDKIGVNKRVTGGDFPSYLCSYETLNLNSEYEHAMFAIEKYIKDTTDKEILKYVLIGYDLKEICDEVGISRREFNWRMCQIRQNKPLEEILIDGIV